MVPLPGSAGEVTW